MSNSIIEVKGIGKKYSINHERGRYVALRDVLTNIAKSPLSFLKKKAKEVVGLEKKEEFWALKDINFTVARGEVVGIIGANGAGKSTLLKILSQITPPTEGEIILRGRVGSLLEVGTGFHPELTGRDNIFLNGAILGMRRHEIASKFDQIVEFAGIEKFLDTPVKHYSSGMYVRLAFSVAAHMEPDILVVDEVLAVGDAEFQKKCLGKMEDITKKDGRTILFVSHNLGAIQQLCNQTILLNKGRLADYGPSDKIVNSYLRAEIGPTSSQEWTDISKAPGDEVVRLRTVRIKQENKITNSVNISKPTGVEMEYEVLQSGHILYPNFHFYNQEDICIFVAGDYEQAWRDRPRPQGLYVTTVWIPGNLLAEGKINVWAAMSTLKPFTVHFHEEAVVSFHIIDHFDGHGARGDHKGEIPGIIRPLLQWETKLEPLQIVDKEEITNVS